MGDSGSIESVGVGRDSDQAATLADVPVDLVGIDGEDDVFEGARSARIRRAWPRGRSHASCSATSTTSSGQPPMMLPRLRVWPPRSGRDPQEGVGLDLAQVVEGRGGIVRPPGPQVSDIDKSDQTTALPEMDLRGDLRRDWARRRLLRSIRPEIPAAWPRSARGTRPDSVAGLHQGLERATAGRCSWSSVLDVFGRSTPASSPSVRFFRSMWW